MSNPWKPILDALPLNRAEKKLVETFYQQPKSRLFLSVALVLRSHKHIDDAVELLSWGVTQQPDFVAARVQLAHELYLKGLMTPAWQTLSQSQTPLATNVLAQKLLFKLSLILGFESSARSIYQFIVHQDMLDAGISRLGNELQKKGFSAAVKALQADLFKEGITVMTQATSGRGNHIDEAKQTDWGLAGFQVATLDRVFKNMGNAMPPARSGAILDPQAMVKKIEAVDICDRQIAYLNSWLMIL